MKRTLWTKASRLLLCAGLLSLAACNDENGSGMGDPEGAQKTGLQQITLTLDGPEDQPSPLGWATDDEVTLKPRFENQELSYHYRYGGSEQTATATLDVVGPTGITQEAFYVFCQTNPSVEDGLQYTLNATDGATQSGNDQYEHLRPCNAQKGIGTYIDGKAPAIQLTSLMAWLTVEIDNADPDLRITSVELRPSNGQKLLTQAVCRADNDQTVSYAEAESQTLLLTETTEGMVRAHLLLIPQTSAAPTWQVIITSDQGNTKTIELDASAGFEAGKQYTIQTDIQPGELAGGTGTAESPLQISTPQQFIDMVQKAETTTPDNPLHVSLTQDIDFSQLATTRAAGTITPIGGGSPVYIDLNGHGRTLRNLHIVGDGETAGLFGVLGQSSIIDNLTLENVTVTGTARYLGAFVGRTEGQPILKDVQLLGQNRIYNETEGAIVGGIVGQLDGRIQSAYVSNTTFVGNEQRPAFAAGGIVGVLTDGTTGYAGLLGNLWSGATILLSDRSGGIVGDTDYLMVANYSSLVNQGPVYGRYYAGGIAGHAEIAHINLQGTQLANHADITSTGNDQAPDPITNYTGGIFGFTAGLVEDNGRLGESFINWGNLYSTATRGETWIGWLAGSYGSWPEDTQAFNRYATDQDVTISYPTLTPDFNVYVNGELHYVPQP